MTEDIFEKQEKLIKKVKALENEKPFTNAYDLMKPTHARQRALIAKILKLEENEGNTDGLTVQQIIDKEKLYFKYTFLTDNRLREMRADGWVESVEQIGKPQKWRLKKLG